MNYDQEMIEGFIEEMLFHGFHCWQCPYCFSALWLEGEPTMLMRYGTTHQDDCKACTEGIEKATL